MRVCGFGVCRIESSEGICGARMSAVGKKKGLLEVFKFGTYVAIPIVMMYAFANNSGNLERIIRNVRPILCHILSQCIFQVSYFYCFSVHDAVNVMMAVSLGPPSC